MKCTKGALTEGNDKSEVGGSAKNITYIVPIFFSGGRSVAKKAVLNFLIEYRSQTVICQELEALTYPHTQGLNTFLKIGLETTLSQLTIYILKFVNLEQYSAVL